MRWLVFFLLVLNVLTFAWFVFDEDQKMQLAEREQHDRFDFSSVPSLQLLGELPESEVMARDIRRVPEAVTLAEVSGAVKEGATDNTAGLEKSEESARTEGGAADAAGVVPGAQCALIGSFPEIVTAKQARGRVEKRGLESRVVMILKQLPAINWVYIAPRASRKEALAVLKSLQEKNVDSFMIADGEYQNAISLGFFSQEESAREVVEERRQQGYDVSLTKKVREQKTYWLAFPYNISSRVDDELIRSLDVDVPDLKRQEKSCRDVALLQSIE